MKHSDPVPRLVEKDCSAVHHPKPGTSIPFIVLTWWFHQNGTWWSHLVSSNYVPTSHRFRFCQFWRPAGMRFMFFHRFTLGRPFTKDLDNSPGFVAYPLVIKHGSGKSPRNGGFRRGMQENHGKSWKKCWCTQNLGTSGDPWSFWMIFVAQVLLGRRNWGTHIFAARATKMFELQLRSATPRCTLKKPVSHCHVGSKKVLPTSSEHIEGIKNG